MIRYLETFFRHRWLISIPALMLICVGTSLVTLMPKKYESSARVWTESTTLLETQRTTNRYIAPSTTHTGRLLELLGTGAFARSIVEQLDVVENATTEERAELIKQVQEDFVVFTNGEHTMTLQFWHTDPAISLAVLRTAIAQYNREMVSSAQGQADQAAVFYSERIQAYEDEILPRSSGAINDYVAKHPELAQVTRTNAPRDPNLALLEEQAARDRDQYERYQERLDEILTQSQAIAQNQEISFRVIDEPTLTDTGGATISKRAIVLFAGVGTLLALGYVGLFLALATELDHTLRSASDVRRKLHLPTLGIVPDFTANQPAPQRRPAPAIRTVPAES